MGNSIRPVQRGGAARLQSGTLTGRLLTDNIYGIIHQPWLFRHTDGETADITPGHFMKTEEQRADNVPIQPSEKKDACGK